MRAQGEVMIRDALRELDMWGASANFSLVEHDDCQKKKILLIKDWKDLVNAVSVCLSVAVMGSCVLETDVVFFCLCSMHNR